MNVLVLKYILLIIVNWVFKKYSIDKLAKKYHGGENIDSEK